MKPDGQGIFLLIGNVATACRVTGYPIVDSLLDKKATTSIKLSDVEVGVRIQKRVRKRKNKGIVQIH